MQHKHCPGASKASLISSLTASTWTSWWPGCLLLAGSTRLQREAYMRGKQGLLAELPFNSLLSTASHLREPFCMSSPAGHSGCGPSYRGFNQPHEVSQGKIMRLSPGQTTEPLKGNIQVLFQATTFRGGLFIPVSRAVGYIEKMIFLNKTQNFILRARSYLKLFSLIENHVEGPGPSSAEKRAPLYTHQEAKVFTNCAPGWPSLATCLGASLF